MKIPNNAPPPAHTLFWIFFGFGFGFYETKKKKKNEKSKKKWAGGFEEAKNFIVERGKK